MGLLLRAALQVLVSCRRHREPDDWARRGKNAEDPVLDEAPTNVLSDGDGVLLAVRIDEGPLDPIRRRGTIKDA